MVNNSERKSVQGKTGRIRLLRKAGFTCQWFQVRKESANRSRTSQPFVPLHT